MSQALRALEADLDGPVVEFFFNPGSRYSYLAASQIPSLQAETGCRVDWRPVSGPEIRALRGRDPFAGEALSGQYDWDYRRYDAECWADYYGIPFRELASHDVDFRVLTLAAHTARMLEIPAADYAWPLCHAVYGEGRWPLDRALCLALAEERGLPVPAFEATYDRPATSADLSAVAQEAYERGVFGVPTFFVAAQMFWGNDRLPLVRHAIGKLVG